MKTSYVLVLWVIATVESPRGEGWSAVNIARCIRQKKPQYDIPVRQVSEILNWFETNDYLVHNTTWEICQEKVSDAWAKQLGMSKDRSKLLAMKNETREYWLEIASQYDIFRAVLQRTGFDRYL